MDTDLIERTLGGQVMNAGVPVVGMPLELTLDSQRGFSPGRRTG